MVNPNRMCLFPLNTYTSCVEYDVSCVFFIDVLYQVECFYHERVLGSVQCLSAAAEMIIWYFSFILLMWHIIIIEKFLKIEVQLIYSVMLVSDVQHSD